MDPLESYFTSLIQKIEASDIGNDGKDEGGFFKPTRALLLRHATLLRDLHNKPNAKPMIKSSWQFVAQNAPPEWLVLTSEQKTQLAKLLS